MNDSVGLLPFSLDYASPDPDFDIDTIVESGRHRRRHQRLAVSGALVTFAAGLVAVVTVVAGGHPNSTLTTATRTPIQSHSGLLASSPPSGDIETLYTATNGWRAVAYLDTAGGLCGGWASPATGIVEGQCDEDDLRNGGAFPADGTAVTPPMQVEPQAATTDRTVDAWGYIGGKTASLSITAGDQSIPVILSSVHTDNGRRIWLGLFPVPQPHGRVDQVAARDSAGDFITSFALAPPEHGAPTVSDSPTPSPTATTTSQTSGALSHWR